MRSNTHSGGTIIWASASDTWNWAHRPVAFWPCSTLSGKRLRIELDRTGDLVDLVVNGGRGDQSVDAHELNAFIDDCAEADSVEISEE